ncbi:MAG: sucrose-6F-phosphate phosphohydrolase-domain-containing protein [Monoraphidium minutum]|nr:MAG: sucrose-6F-phosphate phosphohydrolase-domain-containing protein [Monoraphidium minutum]
MQAQRGAWPRRQAGPRQAEVCRWRCLSARRAARSAAIAPSSEASSLAHNPAFDPFPDPGEVAYATFRWPMQLGGEDVRVSGSWDAWSSQTSLMPVASDGQQVRSPLGDAVRTLLVPRGVHDYKFIVDGKWRPTPTDPVARDQAGATNNKRLFTGNGLITFSGRRDMEVLVMGDWSDWTDAQRMLWNDRTQQWECPLALPPGEYSYVLRVRDQYKLQPDGETSAADILGRPRNINRLVVPPPCAFTLFYATGWPRCSLMYRTVEGEDAEPSEWCEIPFDGAPSRSGPRGDRWMQAIVESPGPDAQLQFYVRGPRPDINDEWGSTSSRRDPYGGNGNGRPRPPSGGSGGEPLAEDRPAKRGDGGGGYYTLPWPSGWKLERGSVSKFLRGLQAPILLCSDVDGTFVSDNGSDAWADTRVADFRTYWEETASLGGSVLVLNTGRSKGALMSLLVEKEDIIAVPDVIITAVGTKIWHRKATHRAFGGCTSDDYEEDAMWTKRLDEGWDLEAARRVAEDFIAKYNKGQSDKRAGWLDRGTEHPHRIALSVRVDVVADIVADMEATLGRSSDGKAGVKGHVIASGAGEWRYLDVVAERGGKLEAIEWVRALYGIPAARCMAAGDSLNDVEMFKGSGPAVIVGNAQRELLGWYHQYREDPPGRVILARAVDASGVLEGLARHGLL